MKQNLFKISILRGMIFNVVLFVVYCATLNLCQSQEIEKRYTQIQNETARDFNKKNGNKQTRQKAMKEQRAKLETLLDSNKANLKNITNYRDLLSLASTAERLGKVSAIKDIANQMIKIDPDHYQGYGFRIRYSLAKSLPKVAEKDIELAEKLQMGKKKISPHWVLVAVCYSKFCQHEKSAECFEKYIRNRYEMAKYDHKAKQPLGIVYPKFRRQYAFSMSKADFQLKMDQFRILNKNTVERSKLENVSVKKSFLFDFYRSISDLQLSIIQGDPKVLTQFTEICNLVAENKQIALAEKTEVKKALVGVVYQLSGRLKFPTEGKVKGWGDVIGKLNDQEELQSAFGKPIIGYLKKCNRVMTEGFVASERVAYYMKANVPVGAGEESLAYFVIRNRSQGKKVLSLMDLVAKNLPGSQFVLVHPFDKKESDLEQLKKVSKYYFDLSGRLKFIGVKDQNVLKASPNGLPFVICKNRDRSRVILGNHIAFISEVCWFLRGVE